MSDKRPGMDYCEVSKRVKRIMSAPGHPQAKFNLVESLKNQVRLREGEAATKAIDRELSHIPKTSSFLSGAGTKQTGIGLGYKWTETEYIANGYTEVAPGKWRKTYG